MKIFVNNEEMIITENLNVEELLRKKGLSKQVAVWVNDRQLLQLDYPKYKLNNNDRVRIIRPLAGG